MSSHYQAVRTLFETLVTGIQDDVDRLITKAYSSNPRPLIGKDQVDASSLQQGVSKAQKARSFLSTVLNRIETDPSGKSYNIFLKILSSEEHLVYLADQIKDEVERISVVWRSQTPTRVSVSIRCEVVCRNYDQLTEGVANSLLEVVTKSLAGELITEETKNECLNETSPADRRAKKLVDALTRGIQLNDSIFDQFVSILHEIPALKYLAESLEVELNNRNGSDAGDHRKDDKPQPKTEVGMDTDGASVVDSTSKASESMPKSNEKQKSLITPEFTGDEQHRINEPASQLLQVSNRAQDEEIPIEASDRDQQSISDTQESGANEKDDSRSEFTERQQSEKERDLRVRELEREKLKDKKNYKTPVEIKYLKAHFLKKGAEVQMEKERKNGIEKVVRAAEELKVNAELQNPEAEAQSEQKDMPLQNEQEVRLQRETKSRDKNDIEKERQRNAEMEVENHQTATGTYDQEDQRRRADSGSPHQQSADLSPVAISPKRKVSSERSDESSESDLEESDSEGDVVKSKPLTLDKQPIQEACPGGFSNEYVLSSTPAKGRRDECLPHDAQQALQAKDAQIDGLKTQVEERISSEEPLRQQLEHKTQEVEVLKERLKKQKEKHQVKVTALNAELQQKNEELEDCKKRVAEMERNHQETLATQRLNKVEKECEAKIREQTEKCQGLQDKIKRLNNERKLIQLEHENRTLKFERELEAKRELAEKEKENYTQMCEIDRLQTMVDISGMLAELEKAISGELHDLKKKNEKLEKDHKLRRESQAQIDELKRYLSDSPHHQAQLEHQSMLAELEKAISGELHDLKKKNEKLEKDHSKLRRESQAQIDELKRYLSDSPHHQAQLEHQSMLAELEKAISGELHDLKKKNEKLEKDHSKLRRESQAQIDELKRHLSDSPQHQAQLEHQSMLAELEKALRKGHILTNLTTCLASGAPGVGKTTLRHYLYRTLPPPLRTSTACIEQAQRAMLRALPAGATECEPVDGVQLKGMIASDFKASSSLIEEPDPPSEILDDQSSHKSGHPDEMSVPKSQQPDMEDDSQSQAQGRDDSPTTTSTTLIDGSTAEDLLQPVEKFKIMKLMETSSASQQLHEVHWMHFIDSGGQAQFMEILPAFARNVSLLLPIVKLSERLSDIPIAAYYDKDSKCYDLGDFIQTNEQLLIQAAHFAMFHLPRFPFPNLEHTPDHPKVMVVGTFNDQEKKEETLKEKNKQLMRSLEPFQKQQILIPRSNQEVIFPVDNTKAGLKPEDPVASELRTAIMKHAPRLCLKMPPQWYLLELELRNLGSKVRVVSKSDCWAIAQQLQFGSEAALDAALRYLHEANFFLYYPDILSDIVITDPSAVIDVITQLFEKHIKLQKAPESDSQMISAEDERFRDQALFTAETIESCNVSYNKELLTNESLMNLLQHRHIVAKIAPEMLGGVTSFFMPSLLQESHTSEIIPPGVATPLYIVYPGNQCTPSGLYCAFMVGLLSSKGRFQWQIHSLHSTPIVKLRKNRIDFTINDHPGMFTLINAKTRYEVHPSSDFPANLVHHLLNVIDDSLKLACSRFSYRVTHQFAFPCSCGDSPSHPAIIVNTELAVVKCTKSWSTQTSKKLKLWLPSMKTERDTSTHHRYDPAYPSVCFLGDPLLESVDSYGRYISWSDVGISISVPPDAIPNGEVVHIKVWPCLQGPFVLPVGYELVSPVYQVSPAFYFKKGVEVFVAHFAALQSDEDCDAMTFVSARSLPQSEHSYPEYHFKDLKKGRFEKNTMTGRVTLNHFCKLAVARQQNHVEGPEAKNLYSVQFYQDVSHQYNQAVFAISLCHPVHSVNLSEMLIKLIPGVKFWPTTKQPMMLSEKYVKLTLPDKAIGWDIRPDRTLVISQDEIDLPIFVPDFNNIPETYPPRILLVVLQVGRDIQENTCTLEVHGLASRNGTPETVEFYLTLLKRQESVFGGLDTASSHQLASAALTEEGPTIGELRLLKWKEGNQEKKLRLIRTIADKWKTLRDLFDIPPAAIDSRQTQEDCCHDVLHKWLESGSRNYPVTWDGLHEALIDIEHSIAAEDLQAALLANRY